jgi:feruloyl esterase
VLGAGASFYHVMVETMIRAHHPDTFYADVNDPAELARLGMEENKFQGSIDTVAQSGARMIVFHGVNDEAMSYLETMKSYEDIAVKYPDHAKWLRVFPVAGLMHCRGGIGPTDAPEKLLEALASWVEKGEAPDTVVATRSAMPFNWIEQGRLETIVPADKVDGWAREFRLCAEPTRVALTAPRLEPKRAQNWTCKVP